MMLSMPFGKYLNPLGDNKFDSCGAVGRYQLRPNGQNCLWIYAAGKGPRTVDVWRYTPCLADATLALMYKRK
jgi:hypothetical protein